MESKFRRKLREERDRRNWTQEKTAAFLGISRTHYVQIELGTSNPSFELAEKIADLFVFYDVRLLLKLTS